MSQCYFWWSWCFWECSILGSGQVCCSWRIICGIDHWRCEDHWWSMCPSKFRRSIEFKSEDGAQIENCPTRCFQMLFEVAFQQGIRTKVMKYLEIITWDKWFHVSFQKFPLLALQPAWLRTFLFADLNLTRGKTSGKPTILKGGSLWWILLLK